MHPCQFPPDRAWSGHHFLPARVSAKGKPRKRNPAPGEPVVLRLQPYELDLLDGWVIEQDDIPETRQDAIRRLIAIACGKMKEK